MKTVDECFAYYTEKCVSREHFIEVLYMWVKQGVISKTTFVLIIESMLQRGFQ